MENGLLPLVTKDADDIAEGLEALRANRNLVNCLPDMNTLTPAGPWLPQAHFFTMDGDGGSQLENTTEFQAFMTKRLLLAGAIRRPSILLTSAIFMGICIRTTSNASPTVESA